MKLWGLIMKREQSKWIDNFKEFVETGSYKRAVDYFTKDFHIAFSSPKLNEMYNIALKIPDQYYNTVFSKLLLGWLCFVCGNNKKVTEIFTGINESQLKTIDEKSTFYALKSMAISVASQGESLKYAKLAVDILPKDYESIIAGNAYMTYGRKLTNVKKYRQGAKYFERGYEIFRKLHSDFLAVNCFVSQCLNLYALGECEDVIKRCQQVLLNNSSKNLEMDSFMNIIKLPMGMCYYEMNKINLAIKALDEARVAIVNMKLVHMHGLMEMYLFNCYIKKNDRKNAEKIVETLQSIFENLNHPQINYIIRAMKVKCAIHFNEKLKNEWVEELELAYQLSPKSIPTFILEALIELKLNKYSEVITKDILIDKLEELQFIGHTPEIQGISLYLAELFYNDKKIDICKAHLKNACDIYLEYGMFSQLINRDLSCLSYVKDLDKSLSKKLFKDNKGKNVSTPSQDNMIEKLTNRELEVLRLVSKGKTNKEISDALFISIGTTKWHVNNIFGKLSVSKRFDAISKAKELNLV